MEVIGVLSFLLYNMNEVQLKISERDFLDVPRVLVEETKPGTQKKAQGTQPIKPKQQPQIPISNVGVCHGQG